MAERFINVGRNTPRLLPPDLRDWVADNDLARLILEAVELCDLRVAARYLCGNHHPDHDTSAHFRRQNGALFTQCFATVAALAREAGVLQLGASSIDGTRLGGAASKRSVRTLKAIEAEL